LVDIYLCRHAHVDYTPPNQITAHNPLTPLGHAMAGRLAERCEALELDLLVASPMRRTQETAAAIRERMPDLPYLLMPEFAEVSIEDLRDFAGAQPHEDLLAWNDDHFVHGNAQMWARVLKGWRRLQEIVAQRGAERVGLVSHGGPLNVIVRHVLGQDAAVVRLRNSWVKIDYAATSCVRYVDGSQGIVWLNDARHIEDLAPVREGLW
jgi:ribonuclease H / adenosylcobalamin/alpha-ribazole phosphatase